MSDQLDLHGVFINSIVGEGAVFSGDVSLGGLFRIDGDFSGTITRADKVLVGKNGRAKCSIRAGTVVVGGVVKGDIRADKKVVILSTGMVLGNIKTRRLLVEEGVVLNGRCTVLRETADEQKVQGLESRGDETSHQESNIERYNPLSVTK